MGARDSQSTGRKSSNLLLMLHMSLRFVILALLAPAVFPNLLLGQGATTPASSHLVIPFLANATKPSDLGFEAGECEIDRAGISMTCQFHQVFLTTADRVPDTCLVTTNQYQRTFQRQAERRWISTEEPAGDCGLLEVVTLQDDGGVRWTMTIRKVATQTDALPACRAIEETVETLSWQNLRRALPCRFIQPGGLSR
jgi:hypothetical protein